ncbi:MAG: beta-lactamase family protein, partial [Candidatus Saccharimonas sp.]|nr:beta-lactamase family protein [Planctomycetaceae bacterium]
MVSRERLSLLGVGLLAMASKLVAHDVIENSLPAAKARGVDQAVQAVVAEQKLVGVAIGILQQGRVVYVKGYGDANREQGVPVSTETVFNWASNSKPVAAVLAMQLVEKKKLDLNADVRKYVPEFPDKGTVITTRHLLCHQSGIPHYANGKIVPTVRNYDVADPFSQPVLALDKFNQSPLIFSPGEKVSYSSHAYILLSAVIERAGEQSLAEQLQSRIAQPLKMTSFAPDTGGDNPEFVVGYAKKGETIARSIDEPQYWKHGAGAYRSSITDFARWAEALLNRRLVSQQTEAAMWT